MAAKTYAQLQAEAAQIANETAKRANTATRVGNALLDVIDSAAPKFDPVVSTTAAYAANTTVIDAAIAAANAAGGGRVTVGPAGTYLVGNITMRSNVTLACVPGAVLKLADGVNNHVVSVAAGATRVGFDNVEIHGNNANNTGGHGISATAAADYITLLDCDIHDCSADGARFTSVSNVIVSSSTFRSNAAQGLTGDSLTYFTFVNNIAASNGFHGIGMIGPCSYGTITGNVAHDNGATAPFADNITGYNSGNRHITISGNVCYGGGNNGMHIGGSYVTITGNVVDTPTQHGIVFFNHEQPTPSVAVGLVIEGNTIKSCPGSGIWLDHVEDSSVTGNVIFSSASHGIYLDSACKSVSIVGNSSKSNVGAGIRVNIGDSLVISGNTCRGNANGIHTSGATLQCSISGNVLFSNTDRGLYIVGTTETLISGNNCKDNGKPLEEDTGSDNNTYTGNDFTGNTAVTPTLIGVNSQWRDNNNGGTANVAVATGLPVPFYTDYAVVTGASGIINSIASGFAWRGRSLTLRFDDANTVLDGNNLKLAGNFTTSADDTITLRAGGSVWYEIGRSNN